MKALHVIPSISPKEGGPSFSLPRIARALRTAKVDVTIATTDDNGRGARIHVTLGKEMSATDEATKIYFRKNTDSYKVSWGLMRWLQQNVGRFDVVHIHALFSFASVAAARSAHRSGIPYVIRPLGVLNRWGLENRRRLLKKVSLRLVELPILRRAGAIHYTSRREQEEAETVDPAIAAARACVIPLPVTLPEAESFDNSGGFFEKLGCSQERRVVLFLSRLDRKKGLELLLDAFSEVHRKFPAAILVITGAGEKQYVKELHRRSKKLGLSADVLWPGFLQGADKVAAFNAATVFVLPSYSENFGIAAAEALASGVPVVLSSEVALSDEVIQADAGLVTACDALAISTAIQSLLADESLCSRLAANGKRLVREQFSAKAVGESLSNLYRSLIKDTVDRQER